MDRSTSFMSGDDGTREARWKLLSCLLAISNRVAMKYISLPMIWILFWVANIIAPVVAIGRALFTLKTRPITDTFHAQNRVAATVLGFNGDATISKECGKSGCRLCSLLCRALAVLLEKGHCEKEAA